MEHRVFGPCVARVTFARHVDAKIIAVVNDLDL
jgi:hypothetical protein